MRNRDANLDLLRACAILMVLAFHICDRWPVPLPRVTAVTIYGAQGVDLFFVLSGWLIGGLLWREKAQHGDVQAGRFIARRALRTMPPYFVALGIAYAGVLVARGEPFDWRYLVFLQNYEERIPFYMVSWSLCIEEHFYLVMPFVALAMTRGGRWSHLALVAVACVPALCRYLGSDNLAGRPFGFVLTATHLRYEGLLLGVWAAHVRTCRPEQWAVVRRLATVCLVPVLLLVAVTTQLSPGMRYTLFYTAVSWFFLCLLIVLVERKPVVKAGGRAVYLVAATSYSVYLTHTFALDASMRLLKRLPENAVLQAAVILGSIGLLGVVFYRLVEVPALALRHRLVPGRRKPEDGR